MRLDDERASRNIEDHTGRRRRGGFGFPRRRMRIPIGRRSGGIGIGGLILLLVVSFVFGINPLDMLMGGGGAPTGGYVQQAPPPSGQQAELKEFVAKVLGTTERTWQDLFAAQGSDYREPVLRFFTGSTPTACGTGQSATGPFYCPPDERIYIDLSFFADLRNRLGAPGDFAQAYVIAHEVGHHVQNLLGIAAKVTAARRQASREQSNALSVRMELQADCLAGVWAYHNRDLLERGDVEEGLNAASAIGDDRLQRRSRGIVVPESFTHGTSAQRVRWFRRGLESGRMQDCDTFNATQL